MLIFKVSFSAGICLHSLSSSSSSLLSLFSFSVFCYKKFIFLVPFSVQNFVHVKKSFKFSLLFFFSICQYVQFEEITNIHGKVNKYNNNKKLKKRETKREELNEKQKKNENVFFYDVLESVDAAISIVLCVVRSNKPTNEPAHTTKIIISKENKNLRIIFIH